MNYRIVAKLLSFVVGALIAAFLVCLAVAFAYSEEGIGHNPFDGFVLSVLISLVIFVLLAIGGRNAGTTLHRKEALCVIGLGWILASLIGAFPYLLSLPGIRLSDAIFESTSGLTTTGASVFPDPESMPRSVLFWRCLSQWIGGMGVVVFFVAVLSFLGAGGRVLYTHESSGTAADFEQGRIQVAVGRILMLYLGLSLACLAAYRFLCGMGWYDALCHMFTTVSTGGFSTQNASLAAFDKPIIEWTAIVFMLVGGTNFLILLQLLKGRWGAVRRNTEVKAFYVLVLLSVVTVGAFLSLDGTITDPNRSVRAAAFQVASIITTTGYATEDFALWSTSAKSILVGLMILGGCSASTAGGVKVFRLVVAYRACLLSVEKSIRPKLIRAVPLNNSPLDDAALRDVLVYLAMIFMITLAAIPLISILEPGMTIESTATAAIACFFNVGPGLGEVGPAGHYGHLHSYTKILLSLAMIMGRIELYAVLVLFLPSLWKRFS